MELPIRFSAHAISVVGLNAPFGGFSMANGSYTMDAVEGVPPGEPFFLSPADAHLVTGARGIDTGIDPSMILPGFLVGC